MLALASYLGVAVDPNSNGATSDNSAEPSSTNTSAMAELDIWSAEYGSSFYEGIKPAFSAPMARRYDSYWNWARQDLMELYYDMVRGNIRKVDLVLAPHCLRLVNRFSPSVVDALKYVVQNAASHPTSPGHMLAQKYGAALIQKCSQAAAAAEPVFQFTLPLLAPRILVDGSGAICYSEVPRPGERSIRDYVDAVTGENGFAVPPRRCANDALDTVLNKLGLLRPAVATAAASPATAKRQLHTHSLPPMVHAKSKAADPTAWAFDPTLSAVLANALHDICDNGLALSGRQALLTGCGQGSIGSQVLRGLLEAGASVVVTTSSYSPKSMRFFQDIYQRHGSRGSVLVVVPFNQASRQDVDALVEYIYADTAKGR
ncbi:fatty acid synthase alpha subunit Lsd1, partial [Coemansia sp. RSA 2673]